MASRRKHPISISKSVVARVQSPVLRADGKVAVAWRDLRNGHQVEIYRGASFIGVGEIDDKTSDSSIIWVVFNDGRGRLMCPLDDGFSAVIHELDENLPQHQNRVITEGVGNGHQIQPRTGN